MQVEAYILLHDKEYRVTIIEETLTHIRFRLYGTECTHPRHEVTILDIEP